MKARMLGEDEKTYQMHDGQAAFRVPKAGLSEAMHAKIRAMGAPQQMAGGGVAANQLDLISGSVANMPNAPAQYGALPATAFSLPPVPGPSVEGIPPPPSYSGAELGLGKGFGPDAEFSLNLPQGQPGASGATPSMIAAANRGHQPMALSAKPVQEETGKTMVQVGTAPDGAPIVEEREGFIAKPIEGLRIKPQAAGAPPTEPPKPAGAPRGGIGLPSTNQAGFAAAEKEGLKAADLQYQADVAKARALAEGEAERGKVMERTAAERARAEEGARQRTSMAMNRVQAAQDEISRVDTSVDPGRYWASRTTGDKVLGIIGLALGAVGAGNDGVNRAATMMTQAIDRDIDAQKAEHDARMRKGQMGLEGAKSFYAMAKDASGDELAAHSLSRSMALDAAANKMAQLEASTGEPMAKARLAALRQQTLQQSAQQKASAQQAMFSNNVELAKLDIARAQASAKGETGPEAKALRGALGTHETLKQTADELKGLIGNTNIVTEKVGEKAARMQSLAGSLLLQVKEAEKLGALDKGSIQVAEQIIGDPGATFTLDSTKLAKLNALVEQSERKVRNMPGAR